MSRLKSSAIFIWIVASIFYAYQFILRVMPSMMFDDILIKFNIDEGIFGQISGVYYIGYSLMHMPLGILLDRVGPRKVMTVCILIATAGLLPIIYSDNWINAILGRALVGIGSSAAILGVFKLIRMLFPEKQFTTMLSLSVTIGLIGAMYGGGPVGYMVDTMGYIMVTKIFIVLGIILAIVTYFIVPEIEPERKQNILGDFKQVFLNPKVMVICIASGLMIGPMEGFADIWGAKFLKVVYDLDHIAAGYLPSLIFVGMCFGAPLLSIMAAKTKSYYFSIISSGIIM